jgi:FAD/FMN-containing dehydrogenase
MALAYYLYAAGTTVLVLALSAYLLRTRLLRRASKAGSRFANTPRPAHHSDEAATRLGESLSASLPDSILYPDHADFKTSSGSYWAMQSSETIPTYIIRPQNVEQLSTAVKILAAEYGYRMKRGDAVGDPKNGHHETGTFAVRSGGHSPVARASSIHDGALIDMSLFCQVIPSQDMKSAVVGSGARWGQVYEELDAKGLAVAGGRNSAVGVGGLILGGGISFFSPRFGFVCCNVLSFEVVLADGSIVTASETSHRDLWCALKGGGNNFGVVTNFELRVYPSSNVWSGFLYTTSGQTENVLSAFHDSVNHAASDNTFDPYAAGPIACFTYLQQLRIQAVSVNLVYTSVPERPGKWPEYWAKSPFVSLWRLWSTFKVRNLADACDEMGALNPSGRRQVFGTTTIKNDRTTLDAVHRAWSDSIADIKRVNIKGMSWTLVLQPCLSQWGRKGDENLLGFQSGNDDPLINVSLTVNWINQDDDLEAEGITKETIQRIETSAAGMGTGHRYRYMNYCGAWQRPLGSYGDDNLRFMKQVSRKYDPHAIFQKACVGGFKLGFSDDEKME